VFAHLGVQRGSLPHAERAASRVLSLPMHPYLTPPLIAKVAGAVKAAVLTASGALTQT
jgi:UDP-2-acetamido-2-deoxy-ribo-hexuluronate aminotransferase